MSSTEKSFDLRRWQVSALDAWLSNGRRGIASVVTGGGKTVFALACLQRSNCGTALVLVPTIALAEQWWEECSSFLDISRTDIKILASDEQIATGTVNIAVLNTASNLEPKADIEGLMLIVDECHKAATPSYRRALNFRGDATLGLSATPDRQYDDGLFSILVPKLGPVIYSYNYREAMRDEVIVPIVLRNVIFDLEENIAEEYRKLTISIARSIEKNGIEAEQTIALLLKRARVVNSSHRRVEIALRIISSHREEKIIVFHEDIESAEVINTVLKENGVSSGIYHSRMNLKERAEVLRQYRSGALRVLVTCRALDEGFNVPDTEIAVIAAGTATKRQRIQRLGRVLRPVPGKYKALIYTLAATKGEIERLRMEERDMNDFAEISWSRA
ncbi:DEAD/DEAH box helicase [Luteibacter sp. CQ10]|uniref:DEAD/DEAH box helicase n=1 Tax=Luteibacter sp. CQ10 TaxID=2805821 RepID=UPI0034A32446